MEKAIFFKNLKFWGAHTVINAIPSFIPAYLHEWDTAESIIAMVVGIILFALMLAYFTSLQCMSKFMLHPIITCCIKVGTFLRMIICIIPLLIFLLIFILFGFYYLIAGVSIDNVHELFDTFYRFELVTGLVSHSFYRSIVDTLSLSITDVRDFTPTLIITLAQGFLLMLTLLFIGLLLSPVHFILKLMQEQARLSA